MSSGFLGSIHLNKIECVGGGGAMQEGRSERRSDRGGVIREGVRGRVNGEEENMRKRRI